MLFHSPMRALLGTLMLSSVLLAQASASPTIEGPNRASEDHKFVRRAESDVEASKPAQPHEARIFKREPGVHYHTHNYGSGGGGGMFGGGGGSMAKTVLGTTAAAGGAVFAGTLAHNAAENLYPVHNNEGGGEGNGGNGGNGGGGGGGGAGSYPVMAQTYPVYANAAPAPASVAASTNNNSPMVPNGYVIYNNQLYTIEQYVQQLGYVRPAPQVTTPGFSG